MRLSLILIITTVPVKLLEYMAGLDLTFPNGVVFLKNPQIFEVENSTNLAKCNTGIVDIFKFSSSTDKNIGHTLHKNSYFV